MKNVDFEKQRAFVLMLRDGYVLTIYDIQILFEEGKEFVDAVIENTGLDIREGKIIENLKQDPLVYYLADDIHLETAGLQEMSEPSLTVEGAPDLVEHQDGYYAMYVCPECGQFHKVDLGDEPLWSEVVRCTQCGKQYRIER